MKSKKLKEHYQNFLNKYSMDENDKKDLSEKFTEDFSTFEFYEIDDKNNIKLISTNEFLTKFHEVASKQNPEFKGMSLSDFLNIFITKHKDLTSLGILTYIVGINSELLAFAPTGLLYISRRIDEKDAEKIRYFLKEQKSRTDIKIVWSKNKNKLLKVSNSIHLLKNYFFDQYNSL